MNRTALFVVLTAAATSACSPNVPDARDYVTRLASARAEKDAQFKREREPVPVNRKSELLPLAYFSIDASYDVPAVLKPSDDRRIVQMATSSGLPRAERRAGTLEFTLKGLALKLTAFVEADAPSMDRLFVPFSDETTGQETYNGGRYLDLDRTPTGLYDLDFNKAYHPYCVYNPTTECPIPPRENHLPLRIEAGERLKPR